MIKSAYTKDNLVLVIEDDSTLSTIISQTLKKKGYDVFSTNNAKIGLIQAKKNIYSALIIDIGLPDLDGLSLVKKIRAEEIDVPIIIITGLPTENNEIQTFQQGASIFHSKPINFQLLLTQLDNLTNKYKKNQIKLENLIIDIDKKLVIVNGKQIRLTFKEFLALKVLSETPGNVLSRAELIDKTFRGRKDIEDGSIDTLISRLRSKVGSDIVETVRGFGYKINI